MRRSGTRHLLSMADLDRDDIESITPTDASPMPDGLLDPLLPAEIRDLIAYLRHPVQVPLP